MNVVDSRDDFPLTISEIMYKALSDRVFPGGVVAFGTKSSPCIAKAYGMYTYHSTRQVTEDSIWDVASLTKILVTTPSIMILYECGMIDLDDRVCRHIPEFQQNGKGGVTVRQLLTHTSGLREFYHFYDLGLRTKQQVLDFIYADKLWYYPGQCRYSDLSMLVLGALVERVTGFRLDVFAKKHIFQPLRMVDTGFRAVAELVFNERVVPTEIDKSFRKRLLWGEVHDPNAYAMGGVAGHAGVFSTGRDIGKFAAMLLNGGRDPASGVRIFRESTLRLFTRPQKRTRRNPRPFALGWDTSSRRSESGYTSAGSKMGPRTFGHTGFTGASLWVDPDHDVFVALLTNAVHPFADVESSEYIREVRPAIADAVMEVAETMVEKSLDVDLLAHLTPKWARGGDKDKEGMEAAADGTRAKHGGAGASIPLDSTAASATLAEPVAGSGHGAVASPSADGQAAGTVHGVPASPRSPKKPAHTSLQQATDEDIALVPEGAGASDAAAVSISATQGAGGGDHAALPARVGEDRLASSHATSHGAHTEEPGQVAAAAAAVMQTGAGAGTGKGSVTSRQSSPGKGSSRAGVGSDKGGRAKPAVPVPPSPPVTHGKPGPLPAHCHHPHHHHHHHHRAQDAGPRPSATASLSQAWFVRGDSPWGPWDGSVRRDTGGERDRKSCAFCAGGAKEDSSDAACAGQPVVEGNAAAWQGEPRLLEGGKDEEGGAAVTAEGGSEARSVGAHSVDASDLGVEGDQPVGFSAAGDGLAEGERSGSGGRGVVAAGGQGSPCDRGAGDSTSAGTGVGLRVRVVAPSLGCVSSGRPSAVALSRDAGADLPLDDSPAHTPPRDAQQDTWAEPAVCARAHRGKKLKKGKTRDPVGEPRRYCHPDKVFGWLPTVMLPAIFITTGFLRVLYFNQQALSRGERQR
eukprot:jgi/Mesvir1/16386/Mv18127-RA.1